MELVTGSYTGNATDNRWINPGFQPDFVIIKGDTSQEVNFRTSDMSVNNSVRPSQNDGVQLDRIQDFGASGFQVGTNAEVNGSGITYFYAAFRDNGEADFVTGSYTGNGADSRNITGLGFDPTIVLIKGNITERGAWRVDENPGDDALRFFTTASATDIIQAFVTDGFQVGTDASTNSNTITYYYVAFADAANFIETGSYAGDDVDDTSITVGFQPELAFVKGNGTSRAYMRIDTMDAGDSGAFTNATPTTNRIQAFEANGFQVGNHGDVNASGTTYYWAAWSVGETGASSSSSSSSSVSFSTSSSSASVSSSSSSISSSSSSTSISSSSSSTSITSSSSSVSVLARLASIYNETGLSVSFSPSVITGIGFYSYHDREILSYSQTKDVSSWFKSATMTIKIKRNQLNNWLLHGLGEDLQVKNSSSEIVFEGFVNKVDINTSEFTVAFIVQGYADFLNYPYENTSTGATTVRLKLIDVLANEPNSIFSTDYSLIETNTLSVFEEEINNKKGFQVIKDLASLGGDSNNNRRIYGLKGSRIFSIEEIPEDISYLALSPTSISIGPLTDVGNQATVKYKDFVTGEENETSATNNVTSQGKHGIFPRVLSGGEISQTNAEAIRDTYLTENSFPETSQTVSGDIAITNLQGGVVDPWDIQPGKWLQFTNLAPSIDTSSNFRQDLKLMFIESVQFSAPRAITLTGLKVSTLEQRLAKLGLGGI